jgi:site-specific DNA recombinase
LWEKTQLSLRSRAIRKNRRTSKSVGSPLTGKLFNENGSGLTPSHAVKGVRRYRYYVSRSLLNGKADLTEHGWRVPAPEIEKKVAGAACQILSDRTEIASAVEAIGLPDNQLPSVFTVVDQWRKRLLSEIEAAAALNAVVDRVELSDSGFRLALKLPMTASGRQAAEKLIYLPITRVVPMKIKRRGVEMRLIMNGNNASIIKADSVLLKTIARAYHWAQDLMSGRMRSVEELAEHHQIGPRYVRRLLQVAFLAPKIVEGIAAGTQPQDLTAEALVERMRLPLLWTEQEQTVFAS